ncbi:MAG: L,D-transpeptidase family protein, partial [Rudaea sp.]
MLRNWAIAVLIGISVSPAMATVEPTANWRDARQMILVIVPDWNATTGTLRTFDRAHGAWHEVEYAAPVVIGHAGSAWGLGLSPPQDDGPIKREGDGRSPAGVFSIGEAFGYAPNLATALTYKPMQSTSWCVDVSGSPYYNRIVDARKVGDAAVKGATEHMRLDIFNHGDQRYRKGFVIENNAQQRQMGGSCVFAHLWGSPDSTTTACTAMADATMDRLLGWLKPDEHPVFVLLPQKEYARLRKAWQLPSFSASTAY